MLKKYLMLFFVLLLVSEISFAGDNKNFKIVYSGDMQGNIHPVFE